MANTPPRSAYDHERVKEDCDNYNNSVLASLAFINVLRWDGEKNELTKTHKYEIGRRMKTSAKNVVSPSTTITPDIVVQSESGAGVIGEVTAKLTTDREIWRDKLMQLKKYDDDLTGWWTKDGRIAGHDVALIINLTRSVLVSDILAEEKELAEKVRMSEKNASADAKSSTASPERKLLEFERKVAVVGFERSSGATKEAITLKKEFGALTNKAASETLRNTVRVALEILVVEYHDKKFADHEPPEPLLLQILWETLFTSYLGEGTPFNEDLGYTPLRVTAKQVTEDLRKYYGFTGTDDHSPQIPRMSWVRKSLGRLVQFGLAHVDKDEFVVHYRRLRGDPLKRFGKLVHEAGPLPSATPTQPSLFSDDSKGSASNG